MRFYVEINLKGEPPFLLPAGYRKNIVSLIKRTIRSCSNDCTIYDQYWGNINTHRAKPFTFFLSVPESLYVNICDNIFLQFNEPSIGLHISSGDPSFLLMLYNGLLKTGMPFSIFNYPAELKGFFLKKDKPINSNTVRFRILSPVIVRDIEVVGDKKNCMGYLSCNNSDFTDSLGHSIRTLCGHFLPRGKKIKMEHIEIDDSECCITKVRHYNEVFPGTTGVIGIKADKDVLELVYNAGLGARRSQGFGMLDMAGAAEDNGFVSVARELAQKS